MPPRKQRPAKKQRPEGLVFWVFKDPRKAKTGSLTKDQRFWVFERPSGNAGLRGAVPPKSKDQTSGLGSLNQVAILLIYINILKDPKPPPKGGRCVALKGLHRTRPKPEKGSSHHGGKQHATAEPHPPNQQRGDTMTQKKPQESAAPRKAHIVTASTPEDKRRATQALIASPEAHAVIVMQASALAGELFDVPEMAEELRAQAKAVQSGDMSRVEAMLITQAIVLEDIFTNMASKAMTQSQLPAMEGLMRMALRAQNQCRATLETLATIKNPPVVIARQANISQGHQQINNAPTHAGKIEKSQNELLEVTNHERLDIRAPSQAIGHDSPMEAVGEKHRGKNRSGKSTMQPQR